jgi:hypothetical protein
MKQTLPLYIPNFLTKRQTLMWTLGQLHYRASLNGALKSALEPLKQLLKIKTIRDLRKHDAAIK